MIHIKGHCLCGHLSYEYYGVTGNIIHCHCSKCRKWHGSPFRSRVIINRLGFRWTSGQDQLTYYDSSENVTKSFCANCGSNLVSSYKHNNDVLGLPVGGVEGNLEDIEQIHIFTKDKASWYTILDNNKQYAALPEDPTVIHQLMDR